jgi:hypothetical protein
LAKFYVFLIYPVVPGSLNFKSFLSQYVDIQSELQLYKFKMEEIK